MNGKTVIVSSPGKVIIHGEHAVVYGKKALACSLDIRTYLKVTRTNDGKVKVTMADIDIACTWDLTDLQARLELPLCDARTPAVASAEVLDKLKSLSQIAAESCDTKTLALVSFLYIFCSIAVDESTKQLPSVHICISSSLPPSAGLGSSAAYSTCLAACLLHHRKLISSPTTKNHSEATWSASDLELINAWAYQSEKILHGNLSGIDNSVSTYGGGLVFQKGNITPLKRIPNLRILLVNTKVPRSTKALVAKVKDKYEKYTSILQPVLDSIEAISETSLNLLQGIEESKEPALDEFDQLTDLVRMNQTLLEFLGVSHPAIDTVCRLASNHQLAAKLTGAGGGGCVFVLLHRDTSSETVGELQQELERQGFSVWETTLGGSGVLCHFSTDSQKYRVPEQLL